MTKAVEKALDRAISALEKARKQAGKNDAKAGMKARELVDDAIEALDPVLKLKSLGPDIGEGKLK